MIDFDLNYRKVSLRVAAHQLGVVLHARGIAVKFHANAVGLLHHVLIGNDVALGIDDHARSERMLSSACATLISKWTATLPAEEAIKEILKWIFLTSASILIALLSAT